MLRISEKDAYFDRNTQLKPKKRDFSKPYELKTVIDYDENELEMDDDIYTTCVKKITSVTPLVHDLTALNLRR